MAAGLLEKYPGWTFATLRRLTLQQIVLVLARPSEGKPASGAFLGNGQADPVVAEVPGSPSLEKELTDLENVKAALGNLLSQETYERAKLKIQEKYGKSRPSAPASEHG
jgi:hypothetical protein